MHHKAMRIYSGPNLGARTAVVTTVAVLPEETPAFVMARGTGIYADRLRSPVPVNTANAGKSMMRQQLESLVENYLQILSLIHIWS